jgi:hypothetical protein
MPQAVALHQVESPSLNLIGPDDLLVARMVDSLEKIVEGRLTSAARIHDPVQRAKVAQGLLPSAVTLKNEIYALRSDSVLEAWEVGSVTYAEMADALGVSKSLIQIMVRESRARRVHA